MLIESPENIEESLRKVPKIIIEKHIKKGKNVIHNFDEGASSNPAIVEHKT